MSSTLSPQTALIYVMVLVSAADREMTDEEIWTMGEIIRTLPVFENFDREMLVPAAEGCAEILQDEDGLETAISLIVSTLPEKLRETAYALACDVAAADGQVGDEEMQILEMLRHRLPLDRLNAAAIERGARARYTRL